MRLILSVGLVLVALLSGAPIQAQVKDKDKDKKSESTSGIKEITEIAGKSFEEWLKEMHSPDKSRAEVAIQTIVNFPHAKAPQAVAEILTELGKPQDANTRLALISSLGTILSQAGNKVTPLQMKKGLELLNKALKDSQIVVRIRAMTALTAIGPDAQGSLKELMDDLLYPIDLDLRVNAINSIGIIMGRTLASAKKRDAQLQQLASRAVLLLSKATDHSQLMVRISALNALKFIGPDAYESIPQILVQLRDHKGTWEVRQAAALALGTVGYDRSFQNEKAQLGQKALIEALSPLKEPCSPVRLAAINSLVMHGFPINPKADPKAPPKGWPKTAPLIVALDRVADKDPEPGLQIAANLAVMRLTLSVPTENLANLTALMKHKDASIRGQATQAIGTVGEKAEKAIPALIDNLVDPEPAVKMLTIWSLGRMGTLAMDAVSSLQKLQVEKDSPDALKKAAKEVELIITGKTKDKKEKIDTKIISK
jgi:HEAT repeat protein